MRDTKLIEILKVFSPKEWKDFEKFVASPYFPRGRDVSGLHALLKKYYPDFNSDKLDIEKVFASLFPKENFNEKKLTNIASDLTKMAEQFLDHECIASDSIMFNETLARVYKNKNNDRLYFKALTALDKKIPENNFASDVCFNVEEKYLLLTEEYYIGIHKFDKVMPIRVKRTELAALSFLVNFLRKQRDRLVLKSGYNFDLNSPLIESVYESIDFDEMLKLMKEKKSEWYWLVEIYYYAFKSMLNLEDKSLYEKFQKAFYENIDKLSRKEQYFIFNDFIAWLVARNDKLGIVSKEEEFEVFKKMLEHNAYSSSEKEYLSVMLYRTIMIMALNICKYEWFENFIKEYTPKLKPEYRDNMETFAKANMYFENGKFEEALERISKIPYDVFIYKLDIKNLMLKIYYELDLYEPAFSLINAFRNFLSTTDEFSDNFKAQHLNFLNFFNKLLKMKAGNNFEDAGFIIKEMQDKNYFASKSWLIKKADNLKKSGKG